MKLLFLHGFAQNGAGLQEHVGPLLARLPKELACTFPSAPHDCSEETITRLRALLSARDKKPHRCWWNATDDGRLYRGWDESLALLREHVPEREPFGLLGFSQGAIVTAVLCALAAHGAFPVPHFAVMVAGRIPRAEALKPMFERTFSVPSLHVYGTRDAMALDAPRLADRFASTTRELVAWDGPHVLPTFGPGAEAIISFVCAKTFASDSARSEE